MTVKASPTPNTSKPNYKRGNSTGVGTKNLHFSVIPCEKDGMKNYSSSDFKRITDWSQTRILVTNDDGIHAEGLAILEAIAHSLSPHVFVVAPESEQSGAGHSLSLHTPLRPQQLGDNRWMVRGTPTDCVLFAFEKVMERKIDLVLSGVNRGSNIAEDITHSGTIAAAMEGTLCGVPSIAMSQGFSMWEANPTVQWDIPRIRGAEVIRSIMAMGIPQGILMNVNFPDCLPEHCTEELRITRTGRRKHGKQLDERLDRKIRPYYWIHWGEEDDHIAHPDSDLTAVAANHISITPINLDLTDYAVMEYMKGNLKIR
jgi:5'-nucleotidase